MAPTLTGERVKAIRSKTGLSQKKFADRLHISERNVENWEQEIHDVPEPARSLLILVEVDHRRVFKALDAALGAPDWVTNPRSKTQ